jgi:hypothetical protein
MSLNRLLELQAQKKQQAAETQQTEKGGKPAGVSPLLPSAGKNEPAALPESKKPTNAPGVESSTPAPNPKKLPFGKPPQRAERADSTSKLASTPASKSTKKQEIDFDNLGSVDLGAIEEAGESNDDEQIEGSGFFDEIEATAPDRELPEDLSEQGREFVSLLDSTYTILNDADMFAQQVRTIMMELQENPEYEKLISDMDVHVMIRAMRNTMGLAKIRKQAKKRTTGTASGRAKSPSKKQALMDKALGLSIGMEIDL